MLQILLAIVYKTSLDLFNAMLTPATLTNPKPIIPKKNKKTRKPSDTTKFTLEQRAYIWKEYREFQEYNRVNPDNAETLDSLTLRLNQALKTHKSKQAFILIFKAGAPVSALKSRSKECA